MFVCPVAVNLIFLKNKRQVYQLVKAQIRNKNSKASFNQRGMNF